MERAQINDVPIPQSFRDRFFGDPCTRFQLVLGSLLDWHLKHGDDRSAIAALRFLEQELIGGLEPDFAENFERTWASAARDAGALLERRRLKNPSASEEQLRIDMTAAFEKLKSIKKLQAEAEKIGEAQFIATEYTRAAESFGSRELLGEARRVHTSAAAALAFIEQREQLGGIEAFLAGRTRPQYLSDRMDPRLREISLAVTEAFVTKESQAILAADNLTRRLYRPDGRSYPYPDLLTFILEAYERDDEACIANELNSAAGYKDRCNENGFEGYAYGFWYQRSRLELLAEKVGLSIGWLDGPVSMGRTTRKTIDLFIRRAWHQGMRYGESAAPSEAVRLLVLAAQLDADGIPKTCKEEDQQVYDTLHKLSWAYFLASSSEENNLVREVAQARIGLQTIIEECGAVISQPAFQRDYLVARAILDLDPEPRSSLQK
ncbi:hypothetical protein ACLBKT_11635 [Erythrobacter sp. W302b]|uniref:hypothetical protein n=1 Tax=Erythrobacter sp. W302b TaxID=3389874 RepID=UPI00396B3B63